MKYTPDYSCRFRILKGGKISLVVSALLVGSSLVGADYTLSAPVIHTTEDVGNLSGNTAQITDAGSITNTSSFYLEAFKAGTIGAASTFWNDGAIDFNASGDDYLASGMIFTSLAGASTTKNSGTIEITNRGTVLADPTTAVMLAAGITGGDAADSNVTNSGTITVATGNTSGAGPQRTGDAVGINIGNLNNADIINEVTTGSITVTSGNATSDSGTMNAFSGKAIGIKALDLSNGSLIQNSGTMSVTGGDSNGYDRSEADFAFGISTRYVTNSSIINSGSLTVNGGDVITYDGYNIEATVGIQALSLISSTITNSGTLSVNGGSLTYQGTPNVLGSRSTGIFVRDARSAGAVIRNTDSIAVNSAGDTFGIEIWNGLDGSVFNDTDAEISAISINGEARGIDTAVLNGDAIISNSGAITATSTSNHAYGIYTTGLNGNALISNSGSIEATSTNERARGIEIDGYLNDNASIINSGTITAISTDSSARGITTGSLNNDASISNSGTINATSTDGEARGIRTSRLYDNASISNSGTITATSTNDYAYGIRTGSVETNAFVLNNHNINATSTSSEAKGIYIDGNLYGSVENNGTLSVNSGTLGTGIEVNYMYDLSTITNTVDGNISVTSTGGNARGIFAYGENDEGIISNEGTITAIASSGAHTAFGIYSDGHIDHITNSGTITAKSDYKSYGIFENGTNANAAINSGTVSGLNASGELFAQGFSFKGVSLNNTSTGEMYGNINASGTINNAGLISLAHQANGGDAASINTFVNAATGTLEIGLLTDGTLGGSTYSKLSTDTATFEDGSTIKVNVDAASSGVALLAGSTLTDVVSASNSLTINGTLNIDDTSSLIKFEYVKDGETIDLNIVKDGTILEGTIAGGGNTQAAAAATALGTIQDAGTYTAMTPMLNALIVESQKGDAALAAAVASTTSQTTTASVGAMTQISNGIAQIVLQRQEANVGAVATGENSGDPMFASENVWLKTYGSFGKQDDKNGLNGFDVKTYGLGMGIDAEYKDKQNIGIGLFYTRVGVDVNNVSQSSNLDVFTTLIYGNVPVIDSKTNFLYQLGYAWQKTDSTRNLFTNQTAKADYTSTTASIDLKLMRDYAVNKDFLLQPIVSTTYRHFDNPAYSESGAGANGLNVNAFTSSELLLGVGTFAHYKLDKNSKIIGNVQVDYDAKGDNASTTAAFQGASGVLFDTKGIDNGRWNYQAGIGYERDVREGHNVNFSYTYQGEGSGYSNNVFSAKYVYSF